MRPLRREDEDRPGSKANDVLTRGHDAPDGSTGKPIAAFQQKIFSQRAVRQLLGGTLVCRKAAPIWWQRFWAGQGGAEPGKGDKSPRRLIYIAIDALHPKYLE